MASFLAPPLSCPVLQAFVLSYFAHRICPHCVSIGKRLRNARHRKILALAVVRGFSSATLWSANFPAVVLVLQFTGVSWLKILPAGLTLSFLLFLLSYLWAKVIGGTVLGGYLLAQSGYPAIFLAYGGGFSLLLVVVVAMRRLQLSSIDLKSGPN